MEALFSFVSRLPQRLRRRFARWRVLRQLAGPKVLAAFAEEVPEALFVEIGANDGKMMDPLRATVLATRWRGWLIEPVPELHAELERNYAGAGDRVIAVNAAIGTSDGPLEFHHLRELTGRPPLPGWARGLGSFRREVILKHVERLPTLPEHLTTVQVPSLTWQSFCARWSVPRVDVVLIDTEGFEAQILAQLDLVVWRPVLLIFEHHHLDPATVSALHERLRTAGYRLFTEGLDTWGLDGRRASPAMQKRWDRAVRRSGYAVTA